MPSFLKRDPIKRAKKHIEKALEELEDGYPDYASTQYEKAARLFLEGKSPDFAVKYFREAANCSLKHNDSGRAAMMKIAAAETLLQDGNYGNASYLFSEASDHFFKAKKVRESIHSVALSILCNLAIRSFDTAIKLCYCSLYLKKHRHESAARFDVISISSDNDMKMDIEHIKDAFDV